MPQDDPTELFDLCAPDGRPLGQTKPRALVHRDGDWHRSVHVWVLLEAAPGRSYEVVLQRRSLTKDTHPGKVDVSVAGHLRAGETEVAVLREAEEEVGLSLAMSDLVRLGQRRHESVRPGHADRELQDVFLAVTTLAFDTLRPDPDEVLALLAVPLVSAAKLAIGELPEVLARELSSGSVGVRGVGLRRDELLLSADGYFGWALSAAVQHLARPPER
jgi:isopentenyldiphosphate isomerase